MSHSGEKAKDEDLTDTGKENPEDEPEELIEEIAEESTDEDEDEDEESTSETTVEEKLEKALAQVTEFQDTALRAEAEMQNVRRRAERDVESAHKYGVERFLQKLLPVVDSLEKAIESANEAELAEDDPVTEGVRLCHKLLLDVLEKEKIEVIDPLGEPFDPKEHEAMSMVENPDMEPNSVFAVVQKGYKLNSRLVRPAMVMVSKAPEEKASDEKASDEKASDEKASDEE